MKIKHEQTKYMLVNECPYILNNDPIYQIPCLDGSDRFIIAIISNPRIALMVTCLVPEVP